MEARERETLRSHFQQLLDTLSGQLPSLKESASPVPPDSALGRLTRMDAIQALEINRHAYRQVQEQVAGLEQALKRIGDPDFGFCSECGNAIPLGRLKAVPGSQRCVNCA